MVRHTKFGGFDVQGAPTRALVDRWFREGRLEAPAVDVMEPPATAWIAPVLGVGPVSLVG